MKSTLLKKLITFFITAVILVNPVQLLAQDRDQNSASVLDDSLGDLYLVLGTGLGGAVLGLSTLSFAEKPSDHMKNIAYGGALGIVVGVSIVIFGQATKSTSTISDNDSLKMTPALVEGLTRLEFSKQKIAQNFLMQPTVDYSFSF